VTRDLWGGGKLRVTVLAHAKINLDLRVLGARADGFHELRTVFQSIDLADELTCVARRGPIVIRTRAPGVPTDQRNLVWQAAAALWRAIGGDGEPRDLAVTLKKRIPVQAGLGGGSSDAAAALRALSRLWGVALDASQLREVASELGADVPFSLCGGTALGLGRGDEIYPLMDLPRHWLVLVLPPFGVSTAEAYGWYDEDRTAGYRTSVLPQSPGLPWPSRAAQLINDLEGPVSRRHPEITAIKTTLRASGAVGAAMSGSGSTVFGLFRRRAEAFAALPPLARLGWKAIVTRTLGRDEYERRSRSVQPRAGRPPARPRAAAGPSARKRAPRKRSARKVR